MGPDGLVAGGSVWMVSFAIATLIGLGKIATGSDGTGLIVAGGVAAALGLVPIVLGVRDLRTPNQLVLQGNGFELSGARGQTSYRWADVNHFRSRRDDEGSSTVVFDVVASIPTRRKGVDHDDELTHNFGMPPEALALLMQLWRRRAVADGPRN